MTGEKETSYLFFLRKLHKDDNTLIVFMLYAARCKEHNTQLLFVIIFHNIKMIIIYHFGSISESK